MRSQEIFRQGLVDACKDIFEHHTEMRNAKAQYWISFCRFASQLYFRLQPDGEPLKELASMTYDIMNVLAVPPCCESFDEVCVFVKVYVICIRGL